MCVICEAQIGQVLNSEHVSFGGLPPANAFVRAQRIAENLDDLLTNIVRTCNKLLAHEDHDPLVACGVCNAYEQESATIELLRSRIINEVHMLAGSTISVLVRN